VVCCPGVTSTHINPDMHAYTLQAHTHKTHKHTDSIARHLLPCACCVTSYHVVRQFTPACLPSMSHCQSRGVATAMQSGHRRCLGVPRAATPAGVRTTLLPQRDGQRRACSSGAVSHRSKPARQHRAGMLASGSRAVRRLHNGFNPFYINASFHFARTHSKRRGLSKRDSAPE